MTEGVREAAFFDLDGTLASSNAVRSFLYFVLAGRTGAARLGAYCRYVPLLVLCVAFDCVSRKLFNLAF